MPPVFSHAGPRLLCVVLLVIAAVGGITSSALAQGAEKAALPTIAEKTEEMTKMDGYVPVYWDETTGRLWLEISRFDTEMLYVGSLPTGLGSNLVGLDRGQLGTQRVVRFERTGPKVLLVAPNLDYRAASKNEHEQKAVREAFAPGVVWGFEVAAEGPDGRVLVDATDFVVRDAHGVARRLENTGQGAYSLAKERSVPVLEHVKAFPENTELEARLTFTTDGDPGEYVEQTAAVPRAVTLRVRHSLVELPDTSGYSPRRFDPRSGLFYADYMDFATPIGESMTTRLINRHRLACAEPPGADGRCPPKEPIVYHLDPGTPEPVRSALLDGARWWDEAFEAAGFEDAYRVEVLPDSADAMDVRYNVIQWVHRRTRGWSYGASVTDPRTGEILKGHVTLGSQRVRQDHLLAEGLLAPYQGAHADGFLPENDPMLEMALARIRQLSAHEVGHTLGLAHNFAGSVNDRASVMDYPAPLARVRGDSITLEGAYDAGVERWDVQAVQYAYARPGPDQTEAALLDSLIRAAEREGLRYVTDADARPPGAAHPMGNLWDNGRDMVEALDREMRVRDVALDRFGEAVVKRGAPLARMEEALVPLYLRHRYQVGATAKLVGGEAYEYATRGEADPQLAERVPASQQTAALDALLSTITPSALALPEAARTRIPPRPPGHAEHRELFEGRTDPTFDPYAPAEVAATMVLDALTQPERALRLVEQHDASANLPGLQGTVTRITDAVWKADAPTDAYSAEVQRTVQQAWTDVLLDRADAEDGAPAVQARLDQHLRTLRDWLAAHPGESTEAEAHRTAIRTSIDRYVDRSHDAASGRTTVDAPPGSPIGQAPGYHRRHVQRQAWLDQWTPFACARQRP
ncbi:zinc-dependent metalloprotease [Salinibacter altiplanensis]|uniref:zinc-dependent metalloprotease n=1 Tax=Salinibacter altiplanensis TaxID=1803181 RepID=UPI000C9FD5DB|nr:zinc-dependent metalloprotease [Salinibacter altiplanensis]